MPTIDVHDIFGPTPRSDAGAISLFPSRKRILQTAVERLSDPENCVAIFGERGVGKTALGQLLARLLDGRITPDEVGIKPNRPLPRRWCVRLNWLPLTPVSPEFLLWHVFDPAFEPGSSFLRQFPEIGGEYRTKFAQIDRKGLEREGIAPASAPGPNQTLMHEVASLVANAIATAQKRSDEADRRGLVIVIDDMELAKREGRAAGFIESSSFQFVLIGTGDEIQDLLGDSQPAARKAERRFARGQFRVEPLTKSEVHELFADASRRATAQGVRLGFSDDFCDYVAEDFSGYPAQTVRFGIDVVLYYQKRLEAGIEVKVRGSDYSDLLREVDISRDIRTINVLDAGVGASVTRWEALKVIVSLRDKDGARWVTLEQISRMLPASSQSSQPLSESLQVLIDNQVLEAKDTGPTAVRVATPAMLCEIKRRKRLNWDPRRRSS